MSTNARMLFIGGPKHGEVSHRQFSGSYIRVPVYTPAYVPYRNAAQPETTSPFHEVIYSQRRVRLGFTSVLVWAPENYSDEAVDRAVADYLEGVTRTVGGR